MQKIIAIDFDGTIANTGMVKAKYLRDNFGVIVPAEGCNRTIYLPLIGDSAIER